MPERDGRTGDDREEDEDKNKNQAQHKGPGSAPSEPIRQRRQVRKRAPLAACQNPHADWFQIWQRKRQAVVRPAFASLANVHLFLTMMSSCPSSTVFGRGA